MIYSVANPVGVDTSIKKMQDKLHSTFLNMGLVTDQLSIFGRAQKIWKGKNSFPMVVLNTEFQHPLFNTDKVISSYFYERGDRDNNNGMVMIQFMNIFHVNLRTLFTSLSHRADAEFMRIVKAIYDREPYGFQLERIYTGLENVYSDFTLDFKDVEDMQPYFALRLDLIKYDRML